ncbi:aspartic proteinase cdr1 [Phtheirospermum japonicum]|uniref:Aspartic proteinase cdr1 n=1 Tax=Phtheirospermum japonicum TaxID=374723 RepID=A0A830CLG5_9LAMI|nr:aspartic proteinase cdr1 [Phtheirospermum japonicum]
MKYSIGNPPTPCIGIVDTGSDLIWTQCTPCRSCFKQTLPIFNPESSSTYRRIPCNTADCERSKPYTYCSVNKEDCLFSEDYADKTATSGVLSIDTLSFASTGGTSTAIPNIVFGCGWRNDAAFKSGETGIVGLGGGAHSLINQLGPLAGGRFSYCLTSRFARSTTSKLHFGDNAVVAGRGVVTIPLMRIEPRTYYHVTLLDVTVGYRRLGSYNRNLSSYFAQEGNSAYILEEGNMVFDSGTTLLMLPAGLYDELKHAVQDHIKLEQAKDPGGVFDLCFQKGRGEVPLPEVVLYFRGGDVILEDDNIFVEQNDQLCLAALPVWGRRGPGIFGYLAQANFLVGYDLNKGEVYLKRTDCTKL